MTSDAKRLANKRNAQKGKGPKNQASKKHVRLNALKHGLFAKELIIKEQDKPEYDALQTMLHRQYAPSTAMQQIGFQRILCCGWRFKLAIRIEMRRLNAHLDLRSESGPLVEGMEAQAEAQRWYLWDRADLRAAAKMLLALRADIEANGWIHAEQWKEPLTKIFSGEFYNLLSDFSPGSIEVIHLAEHLKEHEKLFGGHLPELKLGDSDRKVVVDPRSRWQMMVKIVDLKLQQLNEFRLLLDGRGMGGDSQSAASVDVGSRYFTTAGRDLERAVAWYEYIKQQGL